MQIKMRELGRYPFVRGQYSYSEMGTAVQRRDLFFDHLFFQAVVTTGIYCRTACTAKLPLLKNIRFFSSQKEAGRAGFRACKRCRPDVGSSFCTIRIPVKKDLNFQSVFDFLAIRVVDGIEHISSHHYARSLRIGNEPVGLSVHRAARGRALVVRYWGDVSELAVRDRVASMFDLNAPVANIRHHLGADKVLGSLIEKQASLLLPKYVDPLEGIIRIIIGQLISIKAARTIMARLVQAFGEPLPRPIGGISFLFPAPEILATCKSTELAALGMTSAKAGAIRAVAKLISEGKMDLAALATGTSEVTDQRLQDLPGVGPWTSACIRMEVLGDRNAFPARDLGVLKALKSLTGTQKVTSSRLAEFHRSWTPYAAYATLHLWKHLDSIAQI